MGTRVCVCICGLFSVYRADLLLLPKNISKCGVLVEKQKVIEIIGGGGGGGAANPFGAPAGGAGYGQQGYGYEQQATGGYDQGVNFGNQQQQQQQGYGPPGARPRVDVEASGEVDPNL